VGVAATLSAGIGAPDHSLCWVEGPAALGFEDRGKSGEGHEIGVIRTVLDRAAALGALRLDDLDMLAHVLFGAVCAGVLGMGRSEEPDLEKERFRTVFLELISALVRSADS
jgi:hypothetical protein